MRPWLSVALAAALLLLSRAGYTICPVAAVPGANPTNTALKEMFQTVALGPGGAGWTSKLPAIADIPAGCDTDEHKTRAVVPCELLHAMAYQESNWLQYRKGSTLISFDCGYGLMQITSGMKGGSGFEPALVASDALYNLATGVKILAQKWSLKHCVGARRPEVIEHWYRAVWGYNGFAYINNPLNPTYSAIRGVWNPSQGFHRPYQEYVFGWMENPPSDRWPKVEIAYPNPAFMLPAELGPTGKPKWPEPSCASPTDCVHQRLTHTSTCLDVKPAVATAPATSASANIPVSITNRTDAGSSEEVAVAGSSTGEAKKGSCGTCESAPTSDEGDRWPPLLAALCFAGVWFRRRLGTCVQGGVT